ncbi:MAG: DNA replication and repair protein RecF [Marinifilaceae bacterium]|jgi:DNA replication and repair protein RecF|nr:DNA replication and repair protein RecF [Marinifilaceae bacterium]
MYVKRLEILNYKNIEDLELQFCDGINCLIGNNGVGKTNILDSIYYLSFCKSYFGLPDSQNLRHGADYMGIHAYYGEEESEDVYVAYKKGQKKKFKYKGEEYKKLSDHIGKLSVVMATPYDNNIISGGNEERRKYMDGIISQWDKQYLINLIKYNKAIQQRNAMLKANFIDKELLEVWDVQLSELGKSIHSKRCEFVEKIMPYFQKYYDIISGSQEKVSLEYVSQLNSETFENLLIQSYSKDIAMQYTTVGTHRDNLLFKLDEYPASKIASQGQKKTYLTAMKLAQFDFIKNVSGKKSILILDDIFDKLDADRVEQIVRLVNDSNFGQIFISDTNKDNIDNILKNVGSGYKLFKINKGGIVDETI